MRIKLNNKIINPSIYSLTLTDFGRLGKMVKSLGITQIESIIGQKCELFLNKLNKLNFNFRVKRLRNVLAGCVVGAGAAHLTDRSKLAGCGLGGGLSFLANKFLKNRNRGG